MKNITKEIDLGSSDSVLISPFKKKVAQALNESLFSLPLSSMDASQKVFFLKNQTRIKKNNLVGAPKSKGSIQRCMQNSVLKDLSALFDHRGYAMDWGGAPQYGSFLGFEQDHYHVSNIEQDAKIKIDLNAKEYGLSRKYSTVLCLNTLLLIQNIDTCVANIVEAMTPGGVCVLDFIGETYWYRGDDGRHWHTFNPSVIAHLIGDSLDYVIVPVGNAYLFALSYAAQRPQHPIIRQAVDVFAKNIVVPLLANRRSPETAIHYLVVGQRN